MKCLRSGYCCIDYDVIIVDNPDKGIIEGNLKHKPFGEKCQHLKGDSPGNYSCTVHNKTWYKDSPCSDHGQIEKNTNCNCRLGESILKRT